MGGRLSVLLVVVAMVASALAGILAQPADAQVAERPPLNVVVLGDSYSAGNGARDADDSRAYYGPSGCYRSDYAWNGQYANALKARFNPVVARVACSGGVLGDITERRDMDDVVFRPRFVGCPSAKWDEEWQRTNVNILEAECRRFMKPQIDSVGENTDLVMFTGGGNDARFAKIVERCFATGLRSPDDCEEAVDFADAIITDQMGTRRDGVFAARRAAMRPTAEVLYVGYPHLVEDVDYRLRSINPFSDREYAAGNNVRRISTAGDGVQRAAAARSNATGAHDFTYVDGADIKELFAGRAPNPDQSAPRNPDRWVFEFETRVPAEWYHFNPAGHEGLANYLAANYAPMGGQPVQRANDVDIVFVVDTTGSMGGVISSVRNNLTAIVDNLASSTNSFRVGVVSYRDFPERTSDPNDYPARVDTPFTSDRAAITTAINSLQASGGGDVPESVLSGMDAGLDLSWRAGVTKVMVVIGDAPPLGPPEPITGLTADDIVRRALEIDPVQIFAADTGGLGSAAVREITAGTGGSVVPAGDIVGTIQSIVDGVSAQPFAWVTGPYVGTVGQPYVLDATGSFDPSGEPLTSYEWDVDGDGEWDATTTEPNLAWTFDEPFAGVSVVRVTGPGGTALGSAWIDITATGSASMGDEEPCPLDEGGNPITADDEDGRPQPCTATLREDPPDIVVTSTALAGAFTAVPIGSIVPQTQVRAGSAVPVQFELRDAAGELISDEAAAALVDGTCTVRVSVAGAQELAPTCPTYDPVDDRFLVVWQTARQPHGQVFVSVAVDPDGQARTSELASLTLR
jgi:lysophospholipase L1-like esterase